MSEQGSPPDRDATGALLSVGVIDHVAVAVEDLDAAARPWIEVLGAVMGHREKVRGQGVEVLFLELPGATRIELIAPLEEDGPVARFIERRGGGSLHHVCVLVEDLRGALEALRGAGVSCVDRVPRKGAGGARIAFLHPEAFDGVLVELKER